MQLSTPAFAFVAGVMTIFSPCGYPLLPGYLARYLGTRPSVRFAITGSCLCTLGLVAVFVALGSLPSLFGAVVYQYVPWMIPVSGIVVAAMGVAMMLDFRLPIPVLFSFAPRREGIVGFVLYGVAYGMASLGCSAPVFLSVVVFAFSFGSFFQGVMVFCLYALGMGITLMLLSIAIAKAGEHLLSRFVRRLQVIRRASGILMILTGFYVSYYFFRIYWVPP